MADQREQIILDVEEGPAIDSISKANKALDDYEKRGENANKQLSQSFEQTSEVVIRSSERTRQSTDRLVASIEKRAAAAGKSGTDRLIAERDALIQRLTGEQRAIDRTKAAYDRLMAVQKDAGGSATSLGDRLRQAFQNPLGALQDLIGGLRGLPGIVAAGAATIAGLGVGIFKIVTDMANWVEQLDNVRAQTGMTTQEIQLFTAAAKAQGVSADIVTDLMRGLSKMMEENTPDAIKLRQELGKMGVTLFETGGRAKGTTEIFLQLADVLGKIEDPIKRARAAQEMFGRPGIEALKLFNGELRTTIEEMKLLGAAIDEHGLESMRRMDKRLDDAGVRWDTWKLKAKAAIVDVVDALARALPSSDVKVVAGRPYIVPEAGRQGQSSAVSQFEERVMRDRQLTERREVEAGARIIAEFQRRREQGLAGLQAKLATLAQERQGALGRLGPGIGEAAAQTIVAEVERLDKQIASVQDRIKDIQEWPAKAEAARRQAEAFEKALTAKRLELIRQSEKEALDSAARQAEEMIALEGRVAQARTEYQRETGEIQDRIRQTNFDQAMVMAERSRDEQLRSLDAITARTVEEKIRLEQQKLEIELEYQKRAEELNLASVQRQNQAEIDQAYRKYAATEDIENRIAVLQQESAQRVAIARDDAEARIRATQQESANQQAQIMQAAYDRAFDRIQNAFEGLFDALLTRSRSFGQALLGMLQAVLLTPLKQAMSAAVAGALTGRGGGFSLGGLFGAMPGLGGFGIPGAPGGTGGFAGPVGGLGGLAGMFRGGGAGMTAAGIAPLTLGASVLGGLGAFKLGQRGGLLGGIGGIGLGATSGLLAFGSLSAMFPALIAAGPVGWIAAAGIGATIGILGLLRGKAEDKLREKIRSLYGFEIREKNILQQIAAITKQNFGGNTDLAIRSQPIRDIIELYAMTFSGRSAGLSNVPRPVSAYQSGGAVFSTPSAYAAAPVMSSRLTTVVVQSLSLNLDGQSAADVLEGRVAPVIAKNGNIVQGAVLSAQRSNVGRRKSASNMLAPNLITS